MAVGDPDSVLHAMAARQHGVVTRRQLIEAGVPAHRVDRRVNARRLRTVHAGVYLVGPLEAPRAREMAAALACGPGGVVSHGSAAWLWGQAGAGRPAPAPPHVIARGADCRRGGIVVHRILTLRADESTRLDGIPVTTPARTLLDLAATMTSRELERALAETIALRLARPKGIRAVLDRHPRSPGAGVLRGLLDAGEAPARTRSEAEERLLALVREAGLPMPLVNARVEGFEVDFLWPDARLVVEVDGHAFHGSTPAVERDRRRDARLLAAGYRVLRLTWSQIHDEPLPTLAALVRALAVWDARGRAV